MQSRVRRGSTLMTRARSVDTLMTGARRTAPQAYVSSSRSHTMAKGANYDADEVHAVCLAGIGPNVPSGGLEVCSYKKI